MTREEQAEFGNTLSEMFPAKVNEVQLRAWGGRISKLDARDAMAALEDYYTGPKVPSDGPIPNPAGFMRYYRLRTKPKAAAPVSRWPSWAEIAQREILRTGVDGVGMLDPETCVVIVACYWWKNACFVYGTASRDACIAWLKWQAAAHDAGYECRSPMRSYVSEWKGEKREWAAPVTTLADEATLAMYLDAMKGRKDPDERPTLAGVVARFVEALRAGEIRKVAA